MQNGIAGPATPHARLCQVHTVRMINHMRTTLVLPDHLMRTIKRRAAERGTTLSQVVAEALTRGLEAAPVPDLPPLPTHRMGRPRVDVADRNALYDAMDGA